MIHLYNTISKKVEPLPLKKRFSIYSCGPTVYHYAHIGNFRAYVTLDLLKRLLHYCNYSTYHIINITDVGHLTEENLGEDKILKELKNQKTFQTPQELAEFYEKAFLKDFQNLNCLPPDSLPKASEFVFQMVEHIQKLLASGHAYQTPKGNVYFRLHKFPQYGALSGNKIQDLQTGASERVEASNLQEKEHPSDFALWKTDPQHLMKWKTFLGEGFPGWHIECSTMAMNLIGPKLDLHTGGEDNIFPHHECEIAQSESILGHRWVQHWFHVRHLFLEGEKMSKSLGNILTISDLIDQGYHPQAIRLTLIGTHYRKKLDFTFKELSRFQNLLNQVLKALAILDHGNQKSSSHWQKTSHPLLDVFLKSLQQDLNVAEAFSAFYQFLDDILSSVTKVKFFSRWKKDLDIMLNILGIELIQRQSDDFFKFVKEKIRERKKAKEERNFSRADEIRKELRTHNIDCMDLPGETIWHEFFPLPKAKS